MNILIVEDETALASAREHILKKAGHITDVVGDGQSALDYARGFSYDLLLLDVMLPKLDGFTVVRQLRTEGISVPVLMLTARSAVPDRVTGLNAGADDYLTKPFDPEELLARVNAMTRRTGTVVMDELSFGDVTLALNTAQLSRGCSSVQLSPKEFQVGRDILHHDGIRCDDGAVTDMNARHHRHVLTDPHIVSHNGIPLQRQLLKGGREPLPAAAHNVEGIGWSRCSCGDSHRSSQTRSPWRWRRIYRSRAYRPEIRNGA